jgi:hypothetical protein
VFLVYSRFIISACNKGSFSSSFFARSLKSSTTFIYPSYHVIGRCRQGVRKVQQTYVARRESDYNHFLGHSGCRYNHNRALRNLSQVRWTPTRLPAYVRYNTMSTLTQICTSDQKSTAGSSRGLMKSQCPPESQHQGAGRRGTRPLPSISRVRWTQTRLLTSQSCDTISISTRTSTSGLIWMARGDRGSASLLGYAWTALEVRKGIDTMSPYSCWHRILWGDIL